MLHHTQGGIKRAEQFRTVVLQTIGGQLRKMLHDVIQMVVTHIQKKSRFHTVPFRHQLLALLLYRCRSVLLRLLPDGGGAFAEPVNTFLHIHQGADADAENDQQNNNRCPKALHQLRSFSTISQVPSGQATIK